MFFLSYCDAGLDWQIGLQEPATPVAEGILHFHNYLMYVLLIITILVMWVLYKILTDQDVACGGSCIWKFLDKYT